LASLQENEYPEFQNRNHAKAYELADVSKVKSGIKAQLEKALSYDLLCGFAWFNLGIQFYSEKDFIGATIAFTMCALLQNNDIEAWINAAGCSISSDKTQLMFVFIVRVAYHYNGDKFILELHKRLSEYNKNDLSIYFDMIDKVISKKENKTKTLRLLENDEDHDRLVFETT